ncbi:aminoacyl tRNA synthase complex-interacting multifunctional protein 1-like isoform X1 [Paramormyrops kingsleyae]|uniref:aminoacyl tRNA synthase complex-interacting multifunctional protein 1-like isoform X1 n=1 Tax=Paramormyrops kingsleyae TaxID=1676925 RepID=UPI003B977FE2
MMLIKSWSTSSSKCCCLRRKLVGECRARTRCMLLLKEKALLQASVREEKKLLVENAKLKNDIEDLKRLLLEKQKSRAAVQAAAPAERTPSQGAPSVATAPPQKDGEGRRRRAARRGVKEERRAGAPGLARPLGLAGDIEVDVSRLDVRVGRILMATRHPDADSLYVGEVDVGEETPRTLVSGLAKHVALEEMQGRMAVLLCNLRPSRMRGVLSQAMLLCAASPEKLEILGPPAGAAPGDRVTIPGFSGEPDRELNPKKRLWERTQTELRVDDRGVATYRGRALEVRGRGACRAQTMSSCAIK